MSSPMTPASTAWTDAMISTALDVGMSTVARVRQAAVQEGLDAALHRNVPARVYPRTLDGAGEAPKRADSAADSFGKRLDGQLVL